MEDMLYCYSEARSSTGFQFSETFYTFILPQSLNDEIELFCNTYPKSPFYVLRDIGNSICKKYYKKLAVGGAGMHVT